MNHVQCFLDFDHTLFDTDRFFHVDVRRAFRVFGIGDEVWDESYRIAWRGGYNFEKHLQEICKSREHELPVEKMREELRNSFSNLGPYLYPDVVPFLEAAQKKNIPLYLLSFGDPGWQEYKVNASGLRGFFDSCFFTNKKEEKFTFIAPVIAGHSDGETRVILVDDNARELDHVKEELPFVETYRMNRVPDEQMVAKDEEARLLFLRGRLYAMEVARYSHHACRTLEDIALP